MKDKEARQKIEELEKKLEDELFFHDFISFFSIKKISLKEKIQKCERKLKLLYEFLNVEEKTETEKTKLVKKK